MAIWYSKPASFNKELIWSATTTGDMFYEIWVREDDGTERSVMGGSIPPSALTKNETAKDILYSGTYIASGHQGEPVSIPWSVLHKARYGNEYRILEGDQTNVVIQATATTWQFDWTIQKLNPSTQQYEFDHYEHYVSPSFSQNTGVGRISRGGFFNYMGMSRSWSGYQLGSGIRVTYNIHKDDGTTKTTSNYFSLGDMPIAPVETDYNLVKTVPLFQPVTEEAEYTLYYEKVLNKVQSTTVVKPVTLSYDNYNNTNKYEVKVGNNTIYIGRLYWTKSNDVNLTLNDLANQQIHFNKDIFDKYSGNRIINYRLPELTTYVNDNAVNSSTFYVDYRGANSYDDFDRTEFIRDEVEPWQYILFTALNTSPVEAYTDINGTRYWIPALAQETFKIKADGYDAIRVYNKTLTVNKCSKNKYVLYWLNKRGGFNFISVNGKTIEKESYTKNQFTSGKIQTTENTNWVDMNYQTDVKKQWQLNIGQLNDRQSKLFAEIYGSPCIYVHCIDGNIYAANCTDKSVDVKTFKNQGKKTYFYTLNLTQSNTTNIIL